MLRTAFISASLMLAVTPTASAQAVHPFTTVEHATARCLDRALAVVTTVCEVSAVSRVGQRLVLANDKPMPSSEASPLFSLPFENSRLGNSFPTYHTGRAIDQTRKLEAMTQTLDGRYLIASTGFNRIGDERDADNDGYSTLLYWPANRPEAAHVISPSTRQGVTSSRLLHEQLAKVLGAPFFQVEGLSVAPDNRLLLGIRKQGLDYASAADVFKILSAPFAIEQGRLRLTGDFELLFEFVPQVPGSDEVLGLSSIEYDRFGGNTLYALTSFEQGDAISGYLWAIPLQPMLQGEPLQPQLFVDSSGTPLRFGNKPEGLEVLDASTLLIVHDDDRVQVRSSANSQASGPDEFAYSTVKF